MTVSQICKPIVLLLSLSVILLIVGCSDRGKPESRSALTTATLPAKPELASLRPTETDELKVRLAVVIGNGDYPESPLKNPPNDAADVAGKLKKLGFELVPNQAPLIDAKLPQMEAAIDALRIRLRETPGIGLVYYAGHGVQLNGDNYLIPAGSHFSSEADVRNKAVKANWMLDKLRDAGKDSANLVILDACRNNPFSRAFRGADANVQGLAQADAPIGSLLAFSTAPGTLAKDGDGRNSPYTANLLVALDRPGLSVEQMFKEVRRGVMEQTRDPVQRTQQTPWESTSLTKDIYLNGPPRWALLQPRPTPAPAPASAPTLTQRPSPGPSQIQRFQVKPYGTVLDTSTKLTWMRCALGQKWDGRACTGIPATISWDEASKQYGRGKKIALNQEDPFDPRVGGDSLEYYTKHQDELLGSYHDGEANNPIAGYDDWRLPTVEELSTLVDRKSCGSCVEGGECQRPCISAEAFPNTPASWFWSASPRAEDSSYAWVIYFNYGGGGSGYRGNNGLIRLVRGRQRKESGFWPF